ncbi:MAG: exodeoxyribonuclease VII small subunit [Candidatus Microsaccharimonas sp.]
MSEVNKPVQEKLTELSELVTWFQSPSFKLEDAVTKFKQAEKLAEEIEKDLTKLKNDITVVKKKFDSED